ncbi:MAG: hypothetical protein J0M09_02570 [Xanthomonadales bacterium]|nr:hypothetical protein [Xanthomonadales bacterium]
MKFDQPLTIYALPSEQSLTFETTEAFDEWVRSQISGWSKFGQKHRTRWSEIPITEHVIERQIFGWERMLSNGRQSAIKVTPPKTDRRSFDKIEAITHDMHVNEQLTQKNLLTVDNPIVVRAFAVGEHDFNVAIYMILIASGDIERELRDSKDSLRSLSIFSAAVAGLVETTSITKAFGDIYGSTIRSDIYLKRADSDREAIVSSAEKKMEALSRASKNSVRAASQQRKEIQGEWVKLRATYDNELKLRAPREYWGSKLKEHRALSKKWLFAFVLISIFGAVLIGFSVYSLPFFWKEYAEKLGATVWILPASMIGAPSFLILWLLRVSGRQWSDQMMRQEDARERIVMIETFLALTRDKDSPSSIVDPNHLAIILGSIFRPGPGFASDDSPPAGFFDAVLTRLGSSKSG